MLKRWEAPTEEINYLEVLLLYFVACRGFQQQPFQAGLFSISGGSQPVPVRVVSFEYICPSNS